MESFKVFMSYASEDLEAARRIFNILEPVIGKENIWFDKETLLGGDDWESNIRDGIDEADAFIAVISKNRKKKEGVVHFELYHAIEKSKKRINKKFIIPIRIDDIEFNEFKDLEKIHWLDLNEENFENKLLNTISKFSADLGKVKYALKLKSAIKNKNWPKYIIIRDRGRNYEIDIKYPYIMISEDKYIKESLKNLYNSILENHVFKELICLKSMAREEQENVPYPYELNILGAIYYMSDEFISFFIEEYTYTQGVHGNYYVYTYNISSKICADFDPIVTIDYILDIDERKMKSLLKKCEDIITERYISDIKNGEIGDVDVTGEIFFDDVYEDIESIKNSLSEFNIDDKGILFRFSPYVVAAYAFGYNEVFMPWEEINKYLSEEFKESDLYKNLTA